MTCHVKHSRDAEIRRKARAGVSAQDLALVFGLSVASIRRIIKRPGSETERKIYVGKKTWALVRELSLAEGIPTHALMGRIVREAVKGNG
jgi:hypothetical protein